MIPEKKKELEQLKSNSKELHKSVSKLRERAKVLSASLVVSFIQHNMFLRVCALNATKSSIPVH